MAKTRPNDPCPCGSGRKFKKCCKSNPKGSDEASLPKGIFGQSLKPKGIKTAEEIEGMRKAGQFNAKLMNHLRPLVKEGMSTQAIDDIVREYTLDHGHICATMGYHGYPKNLCTSRNHVVCHGIPSEEEFLEDGDIVNLDLTTIVEGFHGDQSEMLLIGNVSSEAERLVNVAKKCMDLGIQAVRPGIVLNEACGVMEDYVEGEGCSVVREFTGHGIGRNFHEDPQVTHYRSAAANKWMLHPGQTFTIEPMVNLGSWETKVLDDGWTAVTKDGSLSAQWEHTILVTEDGVEILTDTTKV